ncbi:MAG: hypothetical protein ISS45_01620 [Candidatus Omnitrophica bacterium]|nr:hypothetical protein [Candidatus Omnitrophota bacterium]
MNSVSGVYLFVGEDEFSKDIKLENIKKEVSPSDLEYFNFEAFSAKDLDLKTLQEAFLRLPVPASPSAGRQAPLDAHYLTRQAGLPTTPQKRLILIRRIETLSLDLKRYLISYLKKPSPYLVLVLETRRIPKKDDFFFKIQSWAKIITFHQSPNLDAFLLGRLVTQKNLPASLRLLRQLLLRGEKPEKILGALRYQIKKQPIPVTELRRKIAHLTRCDFDIKRSRLKPGFALERLLIKLCYLSC